MLVAALQVEMDCRQCPDAVLLEALCRQEAVLHRACVLHYGQLWMVHRHAAMAAGVLCHDWLDHL